MLSSAKVNHSASAKCDECSGSSHHEFVVARPCEASYIGCRLSEELHTSCVCSCITLTLDKHDNTCQTVYPQFLHLVADRLPAVAEVDWLSADYVLPRTSTIFRERGFSYCGPATWNTLPSDLHNITDRHRYIQTQECTFRSYLPRAVFDGGWTPRENFWPPAAIKKRKGVVYLCTYALARSSTSIAKTSTPLIKFDKYSPVLTTAPGRVV